MEVGPPRPLPNEHVDVPKYIPKQERDHFRDALIAVHGGKPLAGLFYLRMFMELFARRATGETGKCYGDELMEAYYKILPPEHPRLAAEFQGMVW